MEKAKKALITLITATALEFLVIFGLVLFNTHLLMDFSLGFRIILTVVTQWALLVVPVTFMLKDKERLREIGFSKDKIHAQILVGAGLGLAMCVVLTVIPIAFGLKHMISNTRYTKVWQFIYEFIYCILGVAFVEEFFFRGYLFKKLLDVKNNKWFAIIISSAVFGLMHIFQGNIPQVFVTAVIGFVLCVFREKIKHCTLLSLIIAHGIYDALITLCVFLL